MKTKLQISILMLLATAQAAPAHAMWARLSQAALRSGMPATRLTANSVNRPVIRQQNFSTTRPNLLARTLAAQQLNASQNNNSQSHDNDNARNEQQSWWQRWRSAIFKSSIGMTVAAACGYSVHKHMRAAKEKQKLLDAASAFKENLNRILLSEHSEAIDFNLYSLYTNYQYNSDNVRRGIQQFAQDNFEALIMLSYGRTLIKRIINHSPETMETFKELAIKYNNKETLDYINFINAPEYPDASIKSLPHTQTAQHLRVAWNTYPRAYVAEAVIEKIDEKEIHRLIEQLVITEQHEQQRGNYTFVHACPWDLHFFQDLHAKLSALVFNKSSQQLSLRFFNDYSSSGLRAQLLKNGLPKDYQHFGQALQKYVIFVSHSIFAGDLGSKPLAYFLLQ